MAMLIVVLGVATRFQTPMHEQTGRTLAACQQRRIRQGYRPHAWDMREMVNNCSYNERIRAWS